MFSATNDLRQEHAELLENVEELRRLAIKTPKLGVRERGEELDRVGSLLRSTLLPHAEAEEKYLYPLWEELISSPRASEVMVYEHEMIKNLISNLLLMLGTDSAVMQEKLYGLYALICSHFDKEEMVIFTVLDENPEWRSSQAFQMLQREMAQ